MNGAGDGLPGLDTVPALGEQRIVCRVRVPNVGRYRHRDGRVVEVPSSGGAAHTPAVLLAGMLGNSVRFFSWASGILGKDLIAKRMHIGGIRALTPHGGPLTRPRPLLVVVQALLLGQIDRSLLNQNPLALVPLSGSAEADDDRREG